MPRSLSETTKHELLGLKKGRILARHAHFRAPLFGSFPLKPTIDGMQGQKVFNSPRAGIVRGHHGAGLFKTLRDLMGDQAPSKHEVQTATDDLDPDAVTEIVRQLNGMYGSGSRDPRANPWRSAQNLITRTRARR